MSQGCASFFARYEPMTPLDAAITWIHKGFSPVPVPHRSKRRMRRCSPSWLRPLAVLDQERRANRRSPANNPAKSRRFGIPRIMKLRSGGGLPAGARPLLKSSNSSLSFKRHSARNGETRKCRNHGQLRRCGRREALTGGPEGVLEKRFGSPSQTMGVLPGREARQVIAFTAAYSK